MTNRYAALNSNAPAQSAPSLVFYPGEYMPTSAPDYNNEAFGHIYVADSQGNPGSNSIMAAGGKNIRQPESGMWGHTFESTPPGTYVLGPKHHHTTPNWKDSTIPYGADIRRAKNGEDYEFRPEGKKNWMSATGENGVFTKALMRDCKVKLTGNKEQDAKTFDKYAKISREHFKDDKGQDMQKWTSNDFGEWAWQLNRKDANGKLHPTQYYIHTTSDDEDAHKQGKYLAPVNSHGCIHIPPASRDKWMKEGILREGATLTVVDYGKQGPATREYEEIQNLNNGNEWTQSERARQEMKVPSQPESSNIPQPDMPTPVQSDVTPPSSRNSLKSSSSNSLTRFTGEKKIGSHGQHHRHSSGTKHHRHSRHSGGSKHHSNHSQHFRHSGHTRNWHPHHGI